VEPTQLPLDNADARGRWPRAAPASRARPRKCTGRSVHWLRTGRRSSRGRQRWWRWRARSAAAGDDAHAWLVNVTLIEE